MFACGSVDGPAISANPCITSQWGWVCGGRDMASSQQAVSWWERQTAHRGGESSQTGRVGAGALWFFNYSETFLFSAGFQTGSIPANGFDRRFLRTGGICCVFFYFFLTYYELFIGKCHLKEAKEKLGFLWCINLSCWWISAGWMLENMIVFNRCQLFTAAQHCPALFSCV